MAHDNNIYTSIDLALGEAIDSYGSEWSNIVGNAKLNPSLLPGWMACVASAFGLFDKFRVYILKRGEKIEGVVPFYIRRSKLSGVPVIRVELGGNLVSYHQELITDSKHCLLLERFVDYLGEKYHWDIISAENICIGSLTGKTIVNVCSERDVGLSSYPGESSPYLVFDKDWKSILASKQKKFRYKVNKREKILRDSDSLTIGWYTSPSDDIQRLVEEIFYVERDSWKADKGMAITGRQTEEAYYRLLVPYLANKGILFASVLRKDGEAIAYNLCYKFNNCVGQLKTSYHNNYTAISPGAILIEDALRKCIQEGISEFDFLGDIMPHKMAWTKSLRTHELITIYNKSTKGRLLHTFSRTKKSIKKRLGL